MKRTLVLLAALLAVTPLGLRTTGRGDASAEQHIALRFVDNKSSPAYGAEVKVYLHPGDTPPEASSPLVLAEGTTGPDGTFSFSLSTNAAALVDAAKAAGIFEVCKRMLDDGAPVEPFSACLERAVDGATHQLDVNTVISASMSTLQGLWFWEYSVALPVIDRFTQTIDSPTLLEGAGPGGVRLAEITCESGC